MKNYSQNANPNATNSELDAKKIIRKKKKVQPQILSVHKFNGVSYNIRPLTFTPYSRKNWKEMRQKINTFFDEIESDFRLLHKPYSMEVN